MKWLNSLRSRLLVASAVILLLFFFIAAFITERAFSSGLLEAQQDSLKAHIFTMLTSAEELDVGEFFMPQNLPDTRFNQLDSELRGYVFNADWQPVWRSQSTLGLAVPEPRRGQPGETIFERFTKDGEEFFLLSYKVIWENLEAPDSEYYFVIVESRENHKEILSGFRQSLWFWFGLMTLVLLLVLVAILRWGLRPLAEVATELNAIEAGNADQLVGNYPREISRLTDNINLLVRTERGQSQRYQETLANLAHSLKTPLAVIRTSLDNDSDSESFGTIVSEQLKRMNDIVSYQLNRAVTSGRKITTKPISVAPLVDDLVGALTKVYHERDLQFDNQVPASYKLPVERGDLMELLGNLLDNASKWAKRHVLVSVRAETAGSSLVVEDDGEGIEPHRVEAVLGRGKRLDEQSEGQGIGLSVAAEIMSAYQGRLTIERAADGGAKVVLSFPEQAIRSRDS